MPSPRKQLTLADACALIGDCGFGADGTAGGSSHRTVGVELESFTVPSVHPERLPRVNLPAGSRITFEPGGQVELSSPPQRTVSRACRTLGEDLATLRQAFSARGVNLTQSGLAVDPPPRLLDTPRYRAMEAYFDTKWAAPGRAMMCATASVQVNLGLGANGRAWRRWHAANVLGPVLAAAFSSSPGDGGSGSRRLATWLALDPSRTAPVSFGHGGDPRPGWVDYALAAKVMLIRTEDGCRAIVDEPFTAREWIERGHDLGWPTAEDVAYHLTTLFPPVRPRRWLELRMVDALPDPWWRVPVAVAAALVDDPEAVDACGPAAGRWEEAAADGLADPVCAGAAAECAERAFAGLRRVGADVVTAVLVEQWAATVRKGCEPPWQ